MNEPNVPNKMTRDQMKSVALKQRIGEITSQYEDQMADMRATFTEQFDALQELLRDQEKQIEGLQAELKEYKDRDLSQKKASNSDDSE